MKLIQLSVAALCISVMFVACRKDNELTGTNKQTLSTEKADEDVIAQFFAENQAAATQIFKMNADQGGEFMSDEGTLVFVAPGALTLMDGTPVSGAVVGEIVTVNSTADNVMMGFPTQNVWNDQNPDGGAPIATAGSVQLTFKTQDGEQLTAAGGGVRIGLPVNADQGFDPEMRVWEGVPSTDQPRDNVWEEQPEQPEHVNGYYLFNWEGRQRLNIDKLYTCPGTPTPFRVDIAGPFNKNNTEVYVVAQVCGSPGPKAVFSLDMYNPSPIWWTEHTAAGIPIGTNVYFVAIAKIGGNLLYKIENATIVPNHFQHMSGMAVTTPAALAAALNAL